MKFGSTIAYRLGQAHGILGYGAIPGADIPTYFVQKVMPKAWPYARGMSSAFVKRASPYAMGASLAYTWESSGARQRFVDTMLQSGNTGAAWQNTPKQRFHRRKTHGFFLNPRDRKVRGNAPTMGQYDQIRQDYARSGIVWMP